MAAELSQDAVLLFLQSRGGSAPNAELLLHFRAFLREHADRERNREQFKKFVNSVARVKQEDGVSHVVLQRRYRGQSAGSGGSRGESPDVSTPRNAHLSPFWNVDKSHNKSPELKPAQPGPEVLPAAGIILSNNNNNTVEPNLNLPQRKVQQSHVSGPVLASLPPGRRSEPAPAQPAPATPRPHTGLPETLSRKEVKVVPVTFQEPKLLPDRAPVAALTRTTPPPHGLPPAPPPVIPGQAHNNMPRQRQPSSAKPVPPLVRVGETASHSLQPSAPRTTARHRQSYRSALSLGDEEDDDGDDEEEAVVVPDRRASAPLLSAPVWGARGALAETPERGTSHPPTILETHQAPVQAPGPSARSEPHGTGPRQTPPSEARKVSPMREVPPQVSPMREVPPQVSPMREVPVQVSPVKEVPLQVSPVREVPLQVAPAREVPLQVAPVREVPPQASQERTVPQIHIQHVDTGPRREPGPQARFRTGFPLPVHNLYSSSSSVERSPKMGRASSGWSSCEELSRAGPDGQAGGHPAGRRWQRSAAEGGPEETSGRAWHRSTGDLYDDGAVSSASSAPSPPTLRPAAARRQSSNLKRMCLSVGADLDQLMDEDDKRALGGSEAARLHRLQLISSSLSLRHVSSMSSLSSCSTPPRCRSLADLSDQESPRERRSASTSQHQDGPSRHTSHVPLEEREHLWLVRAAAGMWPDIYSLFREDPSLLHKRDFISGFTVLHWIAKHGDHRVLNTLWYGVEKAGLMFDTDSQSSCGYTPLHIAAIHNHKNIIRLLVNKFKASVSLRDAAGRKPWFYLPPGAPTDLFQMLGAPAKAALGPTAVEQTWAAPQTHPQTKKRHRHHRFSSASGQRPLTFSGDVKVKRSTSLAAFLKNKPLQKVKTEWAI